MRSLAAPLALLGLAAGAGACREAPHCTVVAVAVGPGVPPGQLAELGIGADDLRQAAREALSRTRGFSVADREPPGGGARCRAAVSLLGAQLTRRPVPDAPPESAVTRMEVVLELKVEPLEGEGFREAERWGEPVRPTDAPVDSLRRALGGAAAKAAAAVALAFAEAAKPEAEVVRDLDSGDPRVRDYAVRVLAERRSPAAVPGLVARLKDPDPAVVERAVGALAQIRDRRSVIPLIELTYRREGPFVAQLVRIIGDLGGPEAEAFLATLASGYSDAAVKQAAREALAELRRSRAARPEDGGPARGN